MTRYCRSQACIPKNKLKQKSLPKEGGLETTVAPSATLKHENRVVGS